MTTLEKVQTLIGKQLNKPADSITVDKDIVKDLGADSLDVIEMLMGLEEEFNITVSEEETANLKTVGDIIKLIDG